MLARGVRPGGRTRADVSAPAPRRSHRGQPREHALHAGGRRRAGTPSGGARLARPVASGRFRRVLSGQQPCRRLRRTGPARHARFPSGADRPVRGGCDLAAAARPAIVERGGVRSASSASTPSARRREPEGTPGALSVRMPPRTGPLVRADLDRVLVRYAARPGRPTSWWCCRTGARSTPTRPSRCSARSVGRWSGRVPTSSSVAIRTGCRASTSYGASRCCTRWATTSSTWTSWSRRCRAWSSRRRSGAAAQGDPAGAVRDGPGDVRAPLVGARAAARILDDVWSSSTGPFAR